MSMSEEIRHAAVRTKCGMTLLGKCHADCFMQGDKTGFKMSSRAEDQGFITSLGRFVGREEAADVALAAGQVAESVKILFSEDLWSEEYKGKFKYNPIDGYHNTDALAASVFGEIWKINR